MSQQGEEIVKAHYHAFNVRSLEALLDTCSLDVEIDDGLRVDAGLYRGREEVASYFEGLWEVASSAEVVPVELRCHNDRIWVRAKVWARGEMSGAEAGVTFAHVFTIPDRLITRIEVYADPTKAVEAMGLAE